MHVKQSNGKRPLSWSWSVSWKRKCREKRKRERERERQRGWIEPKGWQALTVAVSFITIVTVGEKNERNLSVGGNVTENNLSQSTANFYPGQLVKRKQSFTKSMPFQKWNLSFYLSITQENILQNPF